MKTKEVQLKCCGKKMKNYSVNRVMLSAGNLSSVQQQFAELLESQGQNGAILRKEEVLTEFELKLRFQIAQKVCRDLLKDFRSKGARISFGWDKFYLHN